MSVAGQSTAGCCAELYELPIVEHLLGPSFHPGGATLTRQLARAALVSPGCDVLDVACGNGNSARLIAGEFGATVTGCDYSAINLERAVAASDASGLDFNTRFVRGGAGQLPFAPESFDVVICECNLCLFEDMNDALSEMYRALRTGGRLGISDFFLEAPVPESLDGLLGRVLCVAGAPTLDGYREALARAGFGYVRIRRADRTLIDMIERVRRRLSLPFTPSTPSGGALPASWGDPGPVLADLERFISGGGAGYLIATARRS